MYHLVNVRQTLSSWHGETSEGKRVDIDYIQSDYRDKLRVQIDTEQQLIYLQGEYAGVFTTRDLAQCGFKVKSWHKAVML